MDKRTEVIKKLLDQFYSANDLEKIEVILGVAFQEGYIEGLREALYTVSK